MPVLTVPIQGSTESSRYEIAFYRNGDEINLSCSCRAGESRKLCKHVIGLISGDEKYLDASRYPGARDEWDAGQELLRETRLPRRIAAYLAALEAFEEEKKRLKYLENALKKETAAIVMGDDA